MGRFSHLPISLVQSADEGERERAQGRAKTEAEGDHSRELVLEKGNWPHSRENCDLLSCQKGRAEPGRREQEDSLELACALEERSDDGSGAGRVKNIPKIAQPKPKPAG